MPPSPLGAAGIRVAGASGLSRADRATALRIAADRRIDARDMITRRHAPDQIYAALAQAEGGAMKVAIRDA